MTVETISLSPVLIAEDRSVNVPSGFVIKTGYVDVFKVRLACRERMSIGDLTLAYGKRLQCGSNHPWPCPNGYWDKDEFIIQDGRHEWLVAVALGLTHILVAWLVENKNEYPS
jgi:hypothetical protein